MHRWLIALLLIFCVGYVGGGNRRVAAGGAFDCDSDADIDFCVSFEDASTASTCDAEQGNLTTNPTRDTAPRDCECQTGSGCEDSGTRPGSIPDGSELMELGSTAGDANVGWDSIVTGGKVLYHRFCLYVETYGGGSSGETSYFYVRTGAGYWGSSRTATIRVDLDNARIRLRCPDQFGDVYSGYETVSEDAWHQITVKWDSNSGQPDGQLWVDKDSSVTRDAECNGNGNTDDATLDGLDYFAWGSQDATTKFWMDVIQLDVTETDLQDSTGDNCASGF